MNALAKGFCASAMVGSLPRGQGESWASLWPSPTLQVVDIQRYPKVMTQPFEVSRFYVAVSDTASLIWLVIPPGSEMEELIDTFQIEVGCCVTLNEYTVVAAQNGLNVVVPLSMSYSGTLLSLLGDPRFDPNLFNLSTEALTKRRGVLKTDSSLKVEEYAKVNLIDILNSEGHKCGDTVLHLRIVWKGKERNLPVNGSTARVVFDSIGVDSNGDAVFISCAGKSALCDIFLLGDCVCVVNGNLRHRGGAEDMVQLHVDDRSLSVLFDAESAENIPKEPCRMFGARSVTSIINYANVGDIVCAEGMVISVFPTTLANTKRGRVERSRVVLRDTVSSGSSCVIDVTLWDEFSRTVKPLVGERWCFSGFVVGHFMRRFTLSSRYGSGAFKMQMKMTSECLPCAPHEVVRPVNTSGKEVLQVVLDLEEASETLPVLAKIQRLRTPLTYVACRGCGRQTRRGASGCTACGGCATEERLFVRLELSDGVHVVSAVGFAQIGETLFGMDLPTLLRHREENPAFESALTRELLCLPLLFWLLRSPDDGLLHVVRCQHIDMARCAETLLGAVAQMVPSS